VNIAVDAGGTAAIEGLRVSQVYSNWISLVCQAVPRQIRLRIHRVVASYWGSLGHQLQNIPQGAAGRQRLATHWGRLGNKLRRSRAQLRGPRVRKR